MQNYIRLKKLSLVNHYYVYIDVPEYLADQLFESHHVHIRYDIETWNPQSRYRIISCFVPWWESGRFKAAMKELVALMAYSGKTDYEEVCKATWEEKRYMPL